MLRTLALSFAVAIVMTPMATAADPAPPRPATAPATGPAFDLTTYTGKPFHGEPAQIPGRITFAFYDVGDKGVAFHDLDADNHGSGRLNRGPAERDHFREREPVDISYTKAAFDKFTDGKLLPINEYYVGWTNAGEWLNYTVHVGDAGTFTVKLLVSSNNRDAAISLWVDGVDRTGPVAIPSTGHWHTWQTLESFAALRLESGRHVITVKIEREGNMNLGHMEFTRLPEKKPG